MTSGKRAESDERAGPSSRSEPSKGAGSNKRAESDKRIEPNRRAASDKRAGPEGSKDEDRFEPVEPLIFERSRSGRSSHGLPPAGVPEEPFEELVPEGMIRRNPPTLPEVSELDLVRHYTRLSEMNMAVDNVFYPLGSCTMKYNPRINEETARLEGFSRLHPYQPAVTVQGALRLMAELEEALCEISGMDRITFQPAAGAHGELVGLLLIRAFHRDRENAKTKIVIPDSAHGTNPATASMCGYEVVVCRSDERGGVDFEHLKELVDDQVAGLMLTNPNTLGLFDEKIADIAELIHDHGGLLYYDGANANAIVGRSRPGEMGFDIVHFNLHKTFSTPHGGGGPGAGPVGVSERLVPYLPLPLIEGSEGALRLRQRSGKSVGRVRAFHGNFGVLVRAYTYIRRLGRDGLERMSERAVLNANYLMERLRDAYDLAYDRPCMHEFVLSLEHFKKETDLKVMDVAKRLIDFGFHPPTVYFPQIVPESMMIEPTETENKETLDTFADALIAIAREAREEPQRLTSAPHTRAVGRLDEAYAARNPNLCWRPDPVSNGD